MPQFYTLLTDTGQAKLANAVALGGTIEITELAVGDGNGSLPTPDSSAEALINEVRRAPINASQTDPDNPSWIVVEQVLPPDVGGWTIREIGIYDADGDLIGIGNYPETYKPVLAEGSSRTQTVRFVLEVSDTAAVTLKVDPSVVLATREYVDQQRIDHEASRNHPPATNTTQGMVRFATTEEHKKGARDDRATHPAGTLALLNTFGVGRNGTKNLAVPIAASGTDTTTDFNVIVAPGWWHKVLSKNAPNAPQGGSGLWYLLTLAYASTNVTQIAFPYGTSTSVGTFKWRARHDGVWSPWQELLHSGNFNPSQKADVSALHDHVVNESAHTDDQISISTEIPQASAAKNVAEAMAEIGKFAANGFQNVAVFDMPGATEWTVPDVLKRGLRAAHVTVIGAGGGGGGGTSTTGGGGGGGGGRSEGLVSLLEITTVSVTVGSGGTGSPADPNISAANGNSSSFGAFLSATGGVGAPHGGGGGVAGAPGEGVGGDINYRQNIATVGSPYQGGGGGGFNAGIERRTNGSGVNAYGAGGGGGGALNSNPGGDGGDGMIIVRW